VSLDNKPELGAFTVTVLLASTASVSSLATTSLSDPFIVIVIVAVSVPPSPSEIV